MGSVSVHIIETLWFRHHASVSNLIIFAVYVENKQF